MFFEVVAGVIVGMYIYAQLQKKDSWINKLLAKSVEKTILFTLLAVALGIVTASLYAVAFVLSLFVKKADTDTIFVNLLYFIAAVAAFLIFDTSVIYLATKFNIRNPNRSITEGSAFCTCLAMLFILAPLILGLSGYLRETGDLGALISLALILLTYITPIASYICLRIGRYPSYIEKFKKLKKETDSDLGPQ
jgi:hypothetical protein